MAPASPGEVGRSREPRGPHLATAAGHGQRSGDVVENQRSTGRLNIHPGARPPYFEVGGVGPDLERTFDGCGHHVAELGTQYRGTADPFQADGRDPGFDLDRAERVLDRHGCVPAAHRYRSCRSRDPHRSALRIDLQSPRDYIHFDGRAPGLDRERTFDP